MENRSGEPFARKHLTIDALNNFFRFREVDMAVSKKLRAATRITDAGAERMVRLGFAAEEQLQRYRACVLERFAHIEEFDSWSPVEIYRCVREIRRAVFGAAEEKLWQVLAGEGVDFQPAIDQSHIKRRLITENDTLTLVLTQPELMGLMEKDLEGAGNKRISRFDALPEDPQGAVLYYGEEGLLECRNLSVPAVVTAMPAGLHAQAVTGLWNGEGCVVYIPAGLDVQPHVPLNRKTRLNFAILAALEKRHGEGIYRLPVEELYRRYPAFFVNVYGGGESRLPVMPQQAESLEDFDRQLDEGLAAFLGSFPGVEYSAAYFDGELQRRPVCYDPSQKQPGILVHSVRIPRSGGARVMQCQPGETPRAMFARLKLPGTAVVSNFLFFMTPKLGLLYNDLRADRLWEQADAASGHLDYMLRTGERRVETFPLFGKTCIGMGADGRFRFWNYFLGGGSAQISGVSYRWERTDVNGDGPIRMYTPMYSACDRDADRDTYRKTVGEGRVNVVMLREKVTCIRRGDVLLPSVGVVLSLTEEMAAPLLAKCKPLDGGYYDVSGLELTVKLDEPAGFSAAQWSQMRWAYGGGLTLIQNGIGICDGDDMERLLETEGWMTPLSRQTQESALHTLAKHPRTAIGCAKNGDLLVLVFSGRTWRSSGADYREMIAIARSLYPDVDMLMNGDGGGSAMLGLVHEGEFMELSYPSTSTFSCAGQVRPVNTVFYIPIER